MNQAPSFSTDSDLDYDVKSTVISDTLKLLNISSEERQRVIEKFESNR